MVIALITIIMVIFAVGAFVLNNEEHRNRKRK